MTIARTSQGFRLFFFGAGVWAAFAILVWLLLLSNVAEGFSAMPPLAWHRHEMIFGYTGAALAGFLLTAIPSWTGRAPIGSAPLSALFGLWIAGRIANLTSSTIGTTTALWIDGIFWLALGVLVVHELIASGNRRNLPIALMVMLVGMACVLDHQGHEFAWRLGIATIAMLIFLVGGRVTPSFTRNWLARRGGDALPSEFGGFDKIALLIAGMALVGWVAAPKTALVQAALIVAGLTHLLRLARWHGHRTLAEPLVTILHLGYGWTAAGIGLIGIESLTSLPITGIHALAAGGVAVMTIAVTTRASLGHSGLPLRAGPGIVTVYALVNLGALLRVTAQIWPVGYEFAVVVAGTLWAGGFVLYVILFAPIWLGAVRPRAKQGQPIVRE